MLYRPNGNGWKLMYVRFACAGSLRGTPQQGLHSIFHKGIRSSLHHVEICQTELGIPEGCVQLIPESA